MVEGIEDRKIEEWINLTKLGYTITQIAKKENRHYNVVATAIRTFGIREFRHLTTPEREAIKEEYRIGKSICAISKDNDLSIGTIWRVIKKIAYNKRKSQIKTFEKDINNWSEFTIGYLVGIIEGEGNLNINVEKNREKTRYRVGLTVSNCDKLITDFFKEKISFKLSKNRVHKFSKKPHLRNIAWSEIYEWKLNDKKLLYILFKKLYPYMIAKKEEVGIIIKFLESTTESEKFQLMAKLRLEKSKTNKKVKLVKIE